MASGWLPLESGQIVWDPDFSLSSVENQEAMLAFCDQLDDNLDDNKEDANNKVSCWLRDFDDFLQYDAINLVGFSDKSILSGLPIQNPDLFDKYLYRFATEDSYGKQRVQNMEISFDENNKLRYMSIKAIIPETPEFSDSDAIQ